MPAFKNPFSKTVINDDEPLCNQKDLLSALMLEARSGNNNVLLAPRRSGKTSLAKRLARDYRTAGGLATIVDLDVVPSADVAADRIATALFAALSADRKIFQNLSKLVAAFVPVVTMNPDGSFSVSASPSGLVKNGIDRLVSVVASLDKISSQSKTPLLVVFDEFQDLALLKDSLQIEAALRSTTKHHIYLLGHAERSFATCSNRQNEHFTEELLFVNCHSSGMTSFQRIWLRSLKHPGHRGPERLPIQLST